MNNIAFTCNPQKEPSIMDEKIETGFNLFSTEMKPVSVDSDGIDRRRLSALQRTIAMRFRRTILRRGAHEGRESRGNLSSLS